MDSWFVRMMKVLYRSLYIYMPKLFLLCFYLNMINKLICRSARRFMVFKTQKLGHLGGVNFFIYLKWKGYLTIELGNVNSSWRVRNGSFFSFGAPLFNKQTSFFMLLKQLGEWNYSCPTYEFWFFWKLYLKNRLNKVN